MGKSTLFNCLSNAKAQAANFPFCTIEPNVGVITVPDERLTKLAEIVHPGRIVPATCEIVDIAGLVKGASKGEGLGNKFLGNIRETDAIIHVLRCFDDDNIVREGGAVVNPVEDKEVIDTELQLKDLETVESQLQKQSKIAAIGKTEENKLMLVGDLMHPGDMAVLVIPIDKAAPKGRLILPQQQVIRDILEAEGAAVCVKEYELRETLEKFKEPPAIVITDSQVFAKVSADVPKTIPLTSFSILMARHKGLLDTAVRGIAAVEDLKDGDTVLIAEGCTHHRQCDDIGSVKIPRWLKNYTGKKLNIELCSGREFPEDLSKYALIIHCGGCMLNEREVRYRMKCAVDQDVPITNYGIAIAYMQGILKRSVSMFPYLAEELQESEK